MSFRVRSTGPGLYLSVTINKVSRYCLEVPQHNVMMSLPLPEHDSIQHVISMEMSGKLPQHTRVDAQGRILEDRWLEFQDFKFQDIDLGHSFTESAVYHHDHNGSGTWVTSAFQRCMHFNGRVEWRYDQDPLLWLLEMT